MPAPVVLVHADREFLTTAEAALRTAGLGVAAFSSSLAALAALEVAAIAEVLITCANFPKASDPNGISLALLARTRRPDIKVIFHVPQELARYGDGIGALLLIGPVGPADIVAAVQEVLAA
jgi:DNA-binding NtrC family response regulator